jgi:hypothetical protein
MLEKNNNEENDNILLELNMFFQNISLNDNYKENSINQFENTVLIKNNFLIIEINLNYLEVKYFVNTNIYYFNDLIEYILVILNKLPKDYIKKHIEIYYS